MPQAAVQVQVVAAGLAGGGVTQVGVQGTAVVGGLRGAVRPGDGAEPSGNARTGFRRAGDRGPVGRATAGATGRGRGVGREPVQREALGVGQHGGSVGLSGSQHLTAGRRRGTAAAGRGGDIYAEQCDAEHRDQRDASQRRRQGTPDEPGNRLGESAQQDGHGQGREGGHVDYPGDDPGGRADLAEAEQPNPQRQQVTAQRRQREQRTRGGGQGEGHDGPDRDENRESEPEGGDHLQQEQPANGRDGPVPGQVQVQVDRAGGDQESRPGGPAQRPPGQ